MTDWGRIDLVVFDVDGTLYCQKKMRLLMAKDLLISVLTAKTPSPIKVLKTYRQIRERLGDEEQEDFERKLTSEVADKCGVSVGQVEIFVSEWMHKRPLPYLAFCRFKGVQELFEGLRAAGKIVGVLSDYPAQEKLAALGVHADVVVSANDPGVNILKPHPRGLEEVAAIAGVSPQRTLMIGDRVERDGYAAKRFGAHALIKSRRDIPGWNTFRAYNALKIESGICR